MSAASTCGDRNGDPSGRVRISTVKKGNCRGGQWWRPKACATVTVVIVRVFPENAPELITVNAVPVRGMLRDDGWRVCALCDLEQVLLPGRVEIICETVSRELNAICHVSSGRAVTIVNGCLGIYGGGFNA